MKLIINNVYSFRNRGDSAIVEAMISYFQSRFPEVEIFLSSTFWKENEAYYCERGISSVPPLWDIPMSENKVLRLLMAVGSLFAVLFRFVLPLKKLAKNSVLRLYREADLLIDVGGGSFFSSNKYFIYLGFYQHLFNLLAGKWLKLSVAIAPQSMGPFNKKHDIAAFRHVMKKLDLVMVREKISADLMLDMDLNSVLVPDCAFLANYVEDPSPIAARALEQIDSSCINIGMTVLDWSWAIANRTDSTCNDYLQKIADALAALKIKNLAVHLFSQTDVLTERSDYDVAKELADMLRDQAIESVVHDPENTASDLCHLYEKMDLFLGSRMHSCIFAVTQAVPVVALAYQPKTLGVLNWVSDLLRILPIDTFETEQLELALRDTLAEKLQISVNLKVRAAEFKQEAEEQFDKLILPIIKKNLNENYSGS
jgi:colanic acid/amylovoran biosynthesis protein